MLDVRAARQRTVVAAPIHRESRLGLGAGGYGILLGTLGIGAVAGVVIMPWLRQHFSASVIIAASAAVFGLGSVAIAVWPLWITLVLSVPTGAAWISTLTTLNVGMQLSLAQWVRSRGFSVYLLVFMGTQAGGSFLWGALSGAIGAKTTLLIAAAALAVVAVSVVVLPLLPETGTLDRSVVALCEPDPKLVFEPDPKDGPVDLVIRYRVAEDDVAAFEKAMHVVELSRRRTGGYAWALSRSGQDRDEFREEFRVRSWGEYQRQSSDRWTGYDRESYEAAAKFSETPPTLAHYFIVS
jgi:MFS family permease